MQKDFENGFEPEAATMWLGNVASGNKKTLTQALLLNTNITLVVCDRLTEKLF